MKLTSIINPIWETLSEKLFKSFFDKYKTQSIGASLTLENSTGDDLVELTIGGNSEQVSPYNVRSVSGNAVRVDDSYSVEIKNIVQYGQCVQNGTPTPAAPVAITGKAAGGKVYAGKNLLDKSNISRRTNCVITQLDTGFTFEPTDMFVNIYLHIGEAAKFAGKDVFVTLTTTQECYIYVGVGNGGNYGTFTSFGHRISTAGATPISVPDNAMGALHVRLYYDTPTNDVTVSNLQLELGSTATAYEPYQAPITQTVTDANGDPVTLYGVLSSSGNVTIDGQQYVPDTLEGTTVTRKVGCVDMGTLVWVARGAQSQLYQAQVTGAASGADALSTVFQSKPTTLPNSLSPNEMRRYNDYIYVKHPTYQYNDDRDAFKASMSGEMLYYVLAEPTTETVTISPATLDANSPTTTWLSEAYSTFELPVTGQGNVVLPNPSWPVPIENVGEAIVCNQVIDKSTFVQTKSECGITFTSNGDGSITVNGTATTGWANFILKTNFTFLEGHKYLFAGVEDIADADYVQVYLYGDEGYPNNAACNGIFIIPAEWVISEVCLRVMKNSVVENAVYKPQIFDLTDMFGAGNEPETVEAFREIFPDDYYEFGANVTKYAVPVKVSGKNLLDINSPSVYYSSLSAYSVINSTLTTSGAYYPLWKVYLKPNTTYTVKAVDFSGQFRVMEFTANTTLMPGFTSFGDNASHGWALNSAMTARGLTFTTSSTAVCWYFGIYGEIAGNIISNIQLELGSAPTEYEPYHEPVNTIIYLDEPLRKGDTLEVIGGTLTKRRAVIQSYNGEPVGDNWISTTRELTTGATVEYELATPVTFANEGRNIPTFEGTTIITVDTDPEPEIMIATYWQED